MLKRLRWLGFVLALTPALAQTAPPSGLVCSAPRSCPGPKLDGVHFTLVAGPNRAVGAGVKKWGDYVQLRLILMNFSFNPIAFNPRSIAVFTASGKKLRGLQVEEIVETPGGPGGGQVGGSAPQSIYTPPPSNNGPESATAARGVAAAALAALSKPDRKALKRMLKDPFPSFHLPPTSTVGGYVLIQRTKHDRPVWVEMWLGSRYIRLPLT